MAMIKSDILAAAINFCGDEQIRPYLKGVYIHPEGYISATDGKIAFLARYDGERPAEGFSVHAGDIAYMLKSKPAYLELSPETRLTHGWDTQNPGYPADAIARVFPAECSGVTAQFNVDLLKRIQKAAKAVSVERRTASGTFHIYHNGDGPAGVRFYGRADIWACVMPCRSERAPAWEGALK